MAILTRTTCTRQWTGSQRRQGEIEKRLARRHLRCGGHVLYDVTSSYYEGKKCPLMRFGYSRDGKKGRPIVVYGVLADRRGVPAALRAYPGNTADPVTVPDQLEKLREEFGLENLVLVGDRGMLTEARIEDIRRYPGIGWISALRSEAVRELVEARKIQPSLFDERNIGGDKIAGVSGGEAGCVPQPRVGGVQGGKEEEAA